ncbi:hypothetical protein D9C73_017762 [Collichthys lucidus]|uniref:Uncharacterized protein n=1 Tax=Collichthys lucidus TaxID=240159 RepID=A0A4U5V7G9_COLLU|nr:hypothetical protein D9C73_017762 [Collichthys lucidus]
MQSKRIAKKNMTLNPQECTENQAGPLHKKKPARVSNGLSLEPCKNNHHHQQPSDQENNPRLAHTQGKRKKKHQNKKHSMVGPVNRRALVSGLWIPEASHRVDSHFTCPDGIALP